MAKFFAFIKAYWFGLLTSFILLVGFLFFLLVLVSPRYDAQKRGFISCTEQLSANISTCSAETKYRCIFGAIMQNSWCDIKVIGQGFSLWVKGQQKAPWSNYIFKPDILSAEDKDNPLDQEFYEQNQHPELDLLKLQQLQDVLEKDNAEIKTLQETTTPTPASIKTDVILPLQKDKKNEQK